MKDIDEILLGMRSTEFTFPDDDSFEVRGVRFTIDEDRSASASMFGPVLRLWADEVMIFKHRKIDVVGGMGTQVNDTYSKLQKLRERVASLRRLAEKDAAEAKRHSVINTLLGEATDRAA